MPDPIANVTRIALRLLQLIDRAEIPAPQFYPCQL
jgi:hypothetical protein